MINYRLGGGGLKAAYCNDNFLVIHSSGKANHKDGLTNIPRPPGAGGVSYSSACVTRSYHNQYAVHKIPLYPDKLPQASVSNNLALFTGQSDPASLPSFGLPMSGCVAVTVSGQNMFPLYNNADSVSHAQCEVDRCNAHGKNVILQCTTLRICDIYSLFIILITL